jgi:PIN domain nuclease of toxin-antitoxin system
LKANKKKVYILDTSALFTYIEDEEGSDFVETLLIEAEKDKIVIVEMSRRMGTSRSALDRLLDPKNSSVSLKTLDKAASSLGKKLTIQLV